MEHQRWFHHAFETPCGFVFVWQAPSEDPAEARKELVNPKTGESILETVANQHWHHPKGSCKRD